MDTTVPTAQMKKSRPKEAMSLPQGNTDNLLRKFASF